MCLPPTPLATTTTSLFLSYKFKQSGGFDPRPLLVLVIPGRDGFTITSGGWSGGTSASIYVSLGCWNIFIECP